MKRIAAVAAILLTLLPWRPAHALGPAGTLPVGNEGTGSFAVGAGFQLRELALSSRKSEFPGITARQKLYYAQVSAESYGWEWTGRLGGADFSDGRQFDAGLKPFAGVGVRGTLYGDRMGDYGVTASLRADLFSRYTADTEVGPRLQGLVRVKDFWDAEAALTGYRHFDRLTVYAGPVLEYVEAKIYRTTFSGPGIDTTNDSYYKKKSNAGVAGGLSWQQGGKRIGVEGGASGGSYVIGIEASLVF
ncbi:MAG TPA: hypothetical protein VIU29_02760 [Candidatus Deferrimicrobiaceae bacterium]